MSPSQQLYLVLGRLWLYYQARRKKKSLSLPVPGNTEAEVRPQKRKEQCILLSRPSLEWECCGSKVRKVANERKPNQPGPIERS